MDDARSSAAATYRLAPEQFEELKKAFSGKRGGGFKEWVQLGLTTLIALIGLYATVAYNLFQTNLSRKQIVDKYLGYLDNGTPGQRVAALGSLMDLNYPNEAAEWLVFNPPPKVEGTQATHLSQMDLFLSSRGAPLLPGLAQVAGRANYPDHAIKYMGRIALYSRGFEQLRQVVNDERQSVETRGAALSGLESGSSEPESPWSNEPQSADLYSLLHGLIQSGSCPIKLRAQAARFLAHLCSRTSLFPGREELLATLNNSKAPPEVRAEAIPVADQSVLTRLLLDRNEPPLLRKSIAETHTIPLSVLSNMVASGVLSEVGIALDGIPSDPSSIDMLLAAYPKDALSHNPRAWIIMHLKCCVDDPRVVAFYRERLRVETDAVLRGYIYSTLFLWGCKPATLALLKTAVSDPDPFVKQVLRTWERDRQSYSPYRACPTK
jgi:hypothetical protein